MKDFFWAWKKQSTLPRTPKSFENEFPDVQAIGEDRFESIHDGLLFRFKFQWEIESLAGGRNQITENAYVSWHWVFSCICSKLGVCIFYALFDTLSGAYSVISMILTVISVSIVASCYIALLGASSPADSLIDRGSEASLLMPAATFIFIFLPLMYLTVQFSGAIRTMSILSILGFSTVYWKDHEKVANWSFRWQRTLEQRASSIPMVTGKYVSALLLGSIAPGVFLFSYDAQLLVAVMEAVPYLIILLFAVPVILSQIILRSVVLYERQISEISRFTAEGTNITTRRSAMLSVLITIVMSFLYVYLAYRFIVAANIFFSTYPSVPAAVYILICGLPICYFGFGVVYQSASFLRGLIEIVVNSSKHDFSDIYDCDAETYLLDHSGLVAGAFSIGKTDYIVVSEGYLELLDDKPLAAILAHEEGHLVARDAQIATVIAVLSPFLFVGKNALYALFSFHDRELAADDYAINETDAESLRQALQQMQRQKARKKVKDSDNVCGVIPTMVSFGDSYNTESFLGQYFGFFYGTFAVQEAHPSLSQRIDPLL
jgi:Zn-dependent protease with chaperone function